MGCLDRTAFQLSYRIYQSSKPLSNPPSSGAMDPDVPPAPSDPQPSLFRWILGFLMVGACWGLTTPFMRKAAMNYTPPPRPSVTDPNNSWLKRKILGVWYAVIGVLSRPAYAVPLLLNVTGSVWFFILIGKAGRCYKQLVEDGARR